MVVETAPQVRLARRVIHTQSSAVREILKVTERPEIISFAGGLPAPELFPVEELRQSYDAVLSTAGASALQYSATEGYLPLREWIADRMVSQGCATAPDQVLITTGSQQGIDLVGRALVDPGDRVLVEAPSYLAALQSFRSLEAVFCPVPTDDDGMCMEEAERMIREERPRLIYVMPQFQNPTGATLTLERRIRLVQLSREYGIPILEDDPYGELRYRGESLPSLQSLDRDGLVIRISTFSKVLCPGLRVGWLIAPSWIYQKLVISKQAIDLHTSTLDQRAIHYYLVNHSLGAQIERLCQSYGQRRDTMLKSMGASFPAGLRWTRPEGGMFLWVELPGHIPATPLFERALREKVAFVPGRPFFTSDTADCYLRLNFSNQPPDRISEGIERLGKVIAAA